jgi:hypothetical protein
MCSHVRKRLSFSPERLIHAKLVYGVDSDCARTFFILGDTVAWSHHPHLQIINCLRKMKSERDIKTLRSYGVMLAGTLSAEAFHHFRNSLTGVLGDNRRRNKAGRIWLRVLDEDGGHITVASFWAKRASVTDADLELLRRAFEVKSPLWVDYIDRRRSTCHSRESAGFQESEKHFKN